jgi:hypothetical protein
VIFDDTGLTVQLVAEIQGEFPPGSRPDFTPRPQPGLGWREPAIPKHLRVWLVAMVFALVFLVYMVVITR